MVVACEKCQTRFYLDENIVKKETFRARCGRCRHIFWAKRPVRAELIPFLNLAAARNGLNTDNIITVSNQKGGVAKTSTCLNLGLSLSLLKKRVLLVDFDVQANLTISLGYESTSSFYEVQKEIRKDITEFIIKTKYPNLWLLPSNNNMMVLSKKYFGLENFEYMLKDRLTSIIDQYDYILIDTPPSIDFFTLNALTASSFTIIPGQCEYLAAHGVNQIVKIIDVMKEVTAKEMEYKVLITMYDPENTASKVLCGKLMQQYKAQTFKTIIERDAKIQESQILKVPVFFHDKKSSSALQYLKLAKEILGESK